MKKWPDKLFNVRNDRKQAEGDGHYAKAETLDGLRPNLSMVSAASG